jgi:hypothetical protein
MTIRSISKSVDLMKSRSTRQGRAGAAGISKMTTVIRLKQASRVRPLEGGREGGAIGESLEDDLNESTLRSGFYCRSIGCHWLLGDLDTISIPAQVRAKKGKDLQAHYQKQEQPLELLISNSLPKRGQDGRSGKFGWCLPLLNTKSSVFSQIRKR